MTTVLWFKRDLRLADHAALQHAVAIGEPIIPLFIIEPEYWALPDTSARQFSFLAECLRDLDEALSRHGASLVLRTGDAVAVLEDLRAALGVSRVISHEETGNGWTYARDTKVAAWAAGTGVSWIEHRQCAVVRRLKNRDGWAGQRENFIRSKQVDFAGRIDMPHVASDELPSASRLGLADDACPGRQRGGRYAGLECLTSFLDSRGRMYRKAMSSPVAGERACSRLSPHLAFGTLSVREAAQAGLRRASTPRGAGWSGSLKSFQSRLAWRDHFIQKLEDEPDLEHQCLHSAYEGLRPKTPDAARLEAWTKGETGLPFLDACMRYLNHTGWLNFRMRSMVVAVASYHLWLDWRATGQVLARAFTDYEPGIHWSQMQMQSGTTGMNTIRIYNPVKQGWDQDPDGVFTRRWVTELVDVPDRFLQEPWKWQRARGVTYPEPIIDVAEAARAARTAAWAVRGSAAFRAEANALVSKHASRKNGRGGRHFVDDRTRGSARKAPSPAQLRFDF